MNKIEKLKRIIDESKNIVLFTGAGISVPSGIPDFRSSNGIYSEKFEKEFSPEEIISHSFFMNNTDVFYDFYFKKMVYLNALPNKAHKYFENLKNMKAIVTQNIDNLHSVNGYKNVIELHGSVKRNYCMKCHKYYDISELSLNKIPKCTCGGLIKPDVVLYEEPLDESVIKNAIEVISNADTLIIVGTSLIVYPASSFVRYFKGNNIVLINKSNTSYDTFADLVINDDVINVINELEKI